MLLSGRGGGAVEQPGETVRRVIFPVVGGEKTLRELAPEAEANERAFKARVRTVLRASYSRHCRRMLSPLLGALELRCNNTAYRPVMDAIDLLARYAERRLQERAFFDAGEKVPLDGVVPEDVAGGGGGRRRAGSSASRTSCACWSRCGTRCAGGRSGSVGANRWRNPEDDLPADFEDNRDVHYAALRQPQDPAAFIADLQRADCAPALDRLRAALAEGTRAGCGSSPGTASRGSGCPSCEQAGRAGEPGGAQGRDRAPLGHHRPAGHPEGRRVRHRLHRRVHLGRHPREAVRPDVLRRRLLLVLFALGTNMGIKRVAVTGEHGETEATLRRVAALFVNRDNLRARDRRAGQRHLRRPRREWWGTGTACASRLQASSAPGPRT